MNYLGADEEIIEQAAASTPVSLEELLKAQGLAITRIQRASEENLMFRKIATAAAVAGALFAMIRLSDIYFAVKARRGQQ